MIRKYVNVDPDAIDIHVERDGDSEVLELSVALPERNDGRRNADAAAAAGEA